MRSCAFALLVAATAWSNAAEWHAIEKDVLGQSGPRVNRDSDAEAVFWEITADDLSSGNKQRVVLSHYLRIKVFTERGVRRFATVEIPQLGDERLTGLSARTLKQNGRIVVPDTSSVFERETIKSVGMRMTSTSFVMPQLEPGDMIEYRWQEIRDGESLDEMRIDLQRELPVWRVSFYVRPAPNAAKLILRAKTFNAGEASFQAAPDRPGFHGMHIGNVPAVQREPHSPPGAYTRAWVLLYYDQDGQPNLEEFWKKAGRDAYLDIEAQLRPDKSIEKAARNIAGSGTPAEKLTAIERFARTQIANLDRDDAPVSAEARRQFKSNQHPRETLRKKMGSSSDVLMLFISLARGAGFDAWPARVPDRSDAPFDPNLATTHFLAATSAAVKVAGQWLFFDPSTPYLDYGMLRWQEQGQWALITHPDGGFFVRTPVTAARASLKKRSGNFQLLEDGTLEGTVDLEYTGHAANEQKESLDGMSPGEQIADWTRSTVERFQSAMVKDMKITGAGSDLCPLRITYKVSVPNYAIRTGSRLLIAPAAFQRSVNPLLSVKLRTNPLFFRYAWAEQDEIRIALPEGWTVTGPEATPSATIAIPESADYQAKTHVNGQVIEFRRDFQWNGELTFPSSKAPALAAGFEQVHAHDNKVVVATRVPLKAAR